MIYVDKRAGSRDLVQPIRAHRLPVTVGQFDSDVEFLGDGPDGPTPIGIEHKTISDCLAALTDGRLTGTQIPRMLATYPRVYLMIEGVTRASKKDGLLEIGLPDGRWVGAYGRTGSGWTAREYWARLHSIEEFTGVRVIQTRDVQDSAARIAALYHWWIKDYDQHASWKHWDQSREQRPANILMATSKLPLAIRWARELYNVGQEKAGQIAAHFGSPANMVLADERAWGKVSWVEKIRSGPNKGGIRQRKMTKETIHKIMSEIWGTDIPVQEAKVKGRGKQ
jgi:ERCC4-type nuclease